MSVQLGTLEELPLDYREAMARASIGPLWPQLRNALPHDAPKPVTQPNLWNYSTIRPLLMRAGELTPVEKAACGPHWGRFCGPFHHRVCGRWHCWCAPC